MAAPQAFDPPANFGAPVVSLQRNSGPLPAVDVLDGLSGWSVGSSGLTRIDFPANVVHPGVFPENPFSEHVNLDREFSGASPGDPVVVDSAAGRLVLAAFPVTIPGQGTRPSRHAVELVAAESGSARKAFSIAVPAPESGWGAGEQIQPVATRVVGVADSVAVVIGTDPDGRHGLSAGIDLVTHQVLWTTPADVVAQEVVGDVVVVQRQSALEPEVRGIGVRDGVQRWAGVPGGSVTVSGSRQVLVGHDSSTLVAVGGRSTAVDVGSGKSVASPLSGQAGWECHDDERSVTVCELMKGLDPYALVGLDRDSGAELWRIVADAGRVPPQVTATWHGAVYGFTDSGPVVLDGRTGMDRTPTAAAAPFLVNEYFGVSAAPGSRPEGKPNYTNRSRQVVVPAIS
ncbi:hypothetical protein [Pseudonocardia sp. ICBG601]|uniref:hypothetical protein n=1 Tax=Pseudonocardia sp. ICBG601 TaxID=2846759 RepID=UPI001CF614D3|nr:hypothetical protein [Pseudonocardia sp. ICBG601]